MVEHYGRLLGDLLVVQAVFISGNCFSTGPDKPTESEEAIQGGRRRRRRLIQTLDGWYTAVPSIRREEGMDRLMRIAHRAFFVALARVLSLDHRTVDARS